MVSDRLNRRDALRLSGIAFAGLAGCTTSDSPETSTVSGGGSNPTPSGRSAATATSTPTAGDVSDDDVSLAATRVRQFTDEDTARFRMTLSNTSDAPFVLSGYRLGPRENYFRVPHTDRSASLVIPPTDSLPGILSDPGSGDEPTPPAQPIDGCWRLESDLLITADVQVGEVDAGDELGRTFDVYAHRENEECLPPGTYRLQETHTIQRGRLPNVDLGGNGTMVSFTVDLRITDGPALRVDAARATVP